jgi:TolB protein
MRRKPGILFWSILFLLGLITLACSCLSSGEIAPAAQPSPGVSTAGEEAAPGTAAEATSAAAPEPTAEAEPAFPELKDMGRIVFSSIRGNGLFDIYLMNADGSDVRYLAGDEGQSDIGPAWSPDGEWIAFLESTPEGTFDILRVRPDGTGLQNLTRNAADESAFDWSPDGSQIVFDSNRNGSYDLYVMSADGSGVRQLTRTKDRDEVAPVWSPAGDAVACLCGPSDATPGDVCVVNADGSGLKNLTPDDPDVDDVVWSPDGSQLAFGMPIWPEEVWVMNPDGSDKQNLTDNPADDGGIAYSPDGTMIAFRSDRDGKKNQIYILRLADHSVDPLTDNDLVNVQPAWSPDGTWVVFLAAKSLGEFDYEIYAVRIDGKKLTNLTSNPAKDMGPDWEPL